MENIVYNFIQTRESRETNALTGTNYKIGFTGSDENKGKT